MATSGDTEMATPEYFHLPYDDDKFEGVIVGDLSYYASTDAKYSFTDALHRSLDLWRSKGKKGVWLKIPIKYSQFVHPAIQAGLKFHHAVDSYAMLTHWLSTEENTLPEYATHHISAGAFVLDRNNQMLAVMEKFGAFKGVWKMPTGVIKQGEHIFEGIKREVKEETGIDTKFIEVIGFSESPKPRGKFGKSDVFFLCVLRAESTEIKVQKAELVGAQWMDIKEYSEQDYLQRKPKSGEEKPLLVEMTNASIEAAKEVEAEKEVEAAKEGEGERVLVAMATASMKAAKEVEAAEEGEEKARLVHLANASIKAIVDAAQTLALKSKGFKPEDVKKGIGRHPLYFYNNSDSNNSDSDV